MKNLNKLSNKQDNKGAARKAIEEISKSKPKARKSVNTKAKEEKRELKTITIKPSLYKNVKVRAANDDTSISSIIEAALLKYLQD